MKVTRISSLASIGTILLADAVRAGTMEISDVQRLSRGQPPLAASNDVYVSRTRDTKGDPKAAARVKEKARRKARAKQRRAKP